MVSNFLSHKKYDGCMKLKLKDTIQTKSSPNLSVTCVTQVIKEFCAKSCFKTTKKTSFLKVSLGRYVPRKMSALKILTCQDPLAFIKLNTADISSIICNFSMDLP